MYPFLQVPPLYVYPSGHVYVFLTVAVTISSVDLIHLLPLNVYPSGHL